MKLSILPIFVPERDGDAIIVNFLENGQPDDYFSTIR